ncbi:MAG TPA: hypothetical protein VKL99_04085 [Candidatus Angelobacter sp.]|nr:hypothetical protein [Candidatus Angelobacter sp.]
MSNIFSGRGIFMAMRRNFACPLVWAYVISAVIMVSGCGGSSSSSSPSPAASPNGAPVGNGALAPPNVITVAAGQTASGTNIVVPAPAVSPQLNIIALGVTTGSGGSAFNTGATIARGATMTVLIFGAGLSGNQQIGISGPGDITVSNPQSIVSKTGTPGIAFQAAVASSAALGARTVMVTNAHSDIATFTGGLEVTP